MPQHGDEDAVRIAWIDDHRRDLLAVPQSDVAPAPPTVGGLVDPVAHRQVGPLPAFAAPDVQHVRVRWGDGDRADRTGRLIVEAPRPRASVLSPLPPTAAFSGDVEHFAVIRDAHDFYVVAAAKRPGPA